MASKKQSKMASPNDAEEPSGDSKKRKPNFSDDEILLLLRLYKNHMFVLQNEDKSTDIERKQRSAWQDISKLLHNEFTTTYCDWKEVRLKYNKLVSFYFF